MTSKNKRVVLGMSGGVDSSVAVHLLQKAGYEVHGVHMLMIPDEFGANPDAARDAESVAKQFNISFSVLDVRDKFRNIIIQQFANEYSNGRTPNPCVLCNKVFKFGFLADELQKFDADYISTGHYVNSTEWVFDGNGNCYHLFQKATDAKKDQSYFLAMVNPDIVQKCIFPLGGLTKEEARDIAREIGLPVAEKKDSQEICFIPDNDYKTCLNKVLPPSAFRKGKVFHADGSYLGEHTGIQNYTIGQRKGLGISLGKPAYVVALDAKRNRVILGDNEHLMADTLTASDNNYFIDVPIDEPFAVEAKIRYRAQAAPATLLRHADGTSTVTFAEVQRAITPGQYVAYYIGEHLIGGGVITH
jgi:tRNA-specific 2-thiouridylase